MQGNSLSAIREVAADTQRYPDKLLVAVMQGQDASLPQDIAMAALQTRRELQTALQGQKAQEQLAGIGDTEVDFADGGIVGYADGGYAEGSVNKKVQDLEIGRAHV